MDPPRTQLRLSKEIAALRHIEAAINFLSSGSFDLAITLCRRRGGNAGGYTSHLVVREARRDFEKVADLGSKEWIASLNTERDWLKHETPGLPREMIFVRGQAAIMVARAVSRLPKGSPLTGEFATWFIDYLPELGTGD